MMMNMTVFLMLLLLFSWNITVISYWIESIKQYNRNNDINIFPHQFTGTLTITSHLINETIDESQYPPRTRTMTIYYDYIEQKARIEIESGYEAAKMYIRRYDQKSEYMIRLWPINDCKRSYLGETMPQPVIKDSIYIGRQYVNDKECDYYLHEDYSTRVHIYMGLDGSPVQLVHESIDTNGESIPLLTYDYKDVVLGPPDSSWFDVPEPYNPSECVRHAAGFPYIHIFHYFVKF